MPMTPNEQATLQALADTYTAYAFNNPNWAQNRPNVLNAGSFLVDRCADAGLQGAAMMIGMVKLISLGLAQPEGSKEYKNSVKAAEMFQALYTNDPIIESNMQNGLHQIDPLSAGKLAATLKGSNARPDALQKILAGASKEPTMRPPHKLS